MIYSINYLNDVLAFYTEFSTEAEQLGKWDQLVLKSRLDKLLGSFDQVNYPLGIRLLSHI